MRLMIPAAWNAARSASPPPAGAGPWADPFDEPSGTVLWSRWVAGSTAGTAKVNCDLWSKKPGYSGSTSACEWRTLAGTGRVNVQLLNWEALTAGPMIIRLRCKVETLATPKLWLLFNTVYTNPAWSLSVDITPDGTPPEARVGAHSAVWSDIWVEEHPAYPGWMFLKARLDLTGAPDVDGAFTLHMTDTDQGDELFPVGLVLSQHHSRRLQPVYYRLEALHDNEGPGCHRHAGAGT